MAVCPALFVVAIAAQGEPGYSRSVSSGLTDHFARLFGQGARGRLDGWKEFIQRAGEQAGQPPGSAGEPGQLRPVNGFFNGVRSVEDRIQWGVDDYWATPAEFLASAGGDCEDYAMAKYFALKELGVPAGRLRLVYARTWRSSGAHMVLAYFPVPGAEPLILDNLEGNIRRAADRPDLIPVYMFNDDDLHFARQGPEAVRYDAQSIRKWREFGEKLARELTY